jgi:hypothetical protein
MTFTIRYRRPILGGPLSKLLATQVLMEGSSMQLSGRYGLRVHHGGTPLGDETLEPFSTKSNSIFLVKKD